MVKTAVPGSGHFLVATAVDAKTGRVRLYNPQHKAWLSMSREQMAREWSGRALVLSGQVAQWRRRANKNGKKGASQALAMLSHSEMKRTLGTCYQNMPQAGLGNDPSNMAVGGNCNPAGSPVLSVNATNQNVFADDMPIWFRTASGAVASVSTSYNRYDSQSEGGVLGEKWLLSTDSYAVEQQSSVGAAVALFMPDGQQQKFQFPHRGGFTGTQKGTPVDAGSPNVMYRTTDELNRILRYQLVMPDGTKWLYEPINPADFTSVKKLSQVTDRFGNGLRIQHNLRGWTVQVDEIAGQTIRPALTFSTDEVRGDSPSSPEYTEVLLSRTITIAAADGRTTRLFMGRAVPYDDSVDRVVLKSAVDMGGRTYNYDYNYHDWLDIAGKFKLGAHTTTTTTIPRAVTRR